MLEELLRGWNDKRWNKGRKKSDVLMEQSIGTMSVGVIGVGYSPFFCLYDDDEGRVRD